MSRAETLQEMSAITIKNKKMYSIPFTMKDVGKLGKNPFLLTCILLIAAVVGYHRLSLEQQEELQTANKCENNFYFV